MWQIEIMWIILRPTKFAKEADRAEKMIEIDAWVAGGYKVRAFDWVDGKNIYLNICYYCPGSSLSKPPEYSPGSSGNSRTLLRLKVSPMTIAVEAAIFSSLESFIMIFPPSALEL